MVIKKDHPNIKILESAIQKLGPLVDEMVFLGGCASCLLLSDPATPPPRVTYDVDVIVEAASLLDYQMTRRLADIIQEDASLVRRAKDHIDRLLKEDQGTATGDIMEWRNILDAYPIQRLVRFVTSSSERARRLRQSNPFFAILNSEERVRVEDQLRVQKWQIRLAQILK